MCPALLNFFLFCRWLLVPQHLVVVREERFFSFLQGAGVLADIAAGLSDGEPGALQLEQAACFILSVQVIGALEEYFGRRQISSFHLFTEQLRDGSPCLTFRVAVGWVDPCFEDVFPFVES